MANSIRKAADCRLRAFFLDSFNSRVYSNSLSSSIYSTPPPPSPPLSLHFGDVMAKEKEGRVPAARNHMKGVSERIKSKLDDYSSRGFGSITSEAERADVFEITKDLWLLNHDTSQMLNLVRTVDIALSNFRT